MDSELERTKVRAEGMKETSNIRASALREHDKASLEKEELIHNNIMKELEFMAKHKITCLNRREVLLEKTKKVQK